MVRNAVAAALRASTSTRLMSRASPAPSDARLVDKIGAQDWVLVIGDTRKHQGVDAGKPFEQMQDAGMRIAQLDKIVRQRDPELLAAVEKLSRNETLTGVEMLRRQGRVHEVKDREDRTAAIAKAYADKPENTIIVSADNASRREINRAVRAELQERSYISVDNHYLPTLMPRSELTGADRRWAAITTRARFSITASAARS